MINYIKVKRSLWIKGNKEERYMARIYRGSNVSLDSIANQISHATTISYPDVLACLKALEIHVSNAVLNGQAVKFGTLGMFIPALRSKAVAAANDVDADTVKRVTCRFYPSSAFKNNLKGAMLEYKDLNKVKHV